jgi:flagellar biosynthesis protein FlhA
MLQRLLKNIIRDGIPIRELTAILESLGEHAPKTTNVAVLTEMVRKRLSRTITELHKNADSKILAITLEPALEHQMSSTLQQNGDGISLALPTELAMDVSRAVARVWRAVMDAGHEGVILLCDSRLRSSLAEMLSRTVPLMPVVAYDEIVLGTEVEPIETVSIHQGGSAAPNEQELATVAE